MDFERLPDGTWIVGRWWIRMPIRRATWIFGRQHLVGIHEMGGVVSEITPASGVRDTPARLDSPVPSLSQDSGTASPGVHSRPGRVGLDPAPSILPSRYAASPLKRVFAPIGRLEPLRPGSQEPGAKATKASSPRE